MSKPNIYIDIETTGLNQLFGNIIEVGIALVEDYTVVDLFSSPIVQPRVMDQIYRDLLDPVIKKMHGPEGSGLIDKLVRLDREKAEWVSKERVTQMCIQVVQSWDLGKVPVYGSSVHFDRKWLDFHMPGLDELFHYRCVDSTSQMEFMKAHYPDLAKAIDEDPSKADPGKHDVVSDIFASIDLQRRIDNHVFAPAARHLEIQDRVSGYLAHGGEIGIGQAAVTFEHPDQEEPTE